MFSRLTRPFGEGGRAWQFAHFILGHLRRVRSYTRRTWPGLDPARASGYEAVYVHFDTQGVVHDYVLEQLRQLVAANFRITFVTNALRLHQDSVEAVRPLCRQVIWRTNAGYDFGAYKDGIAALGDIRKCDRLLLMNDSVYGPFRPIADVLNTIDSSEVDIWGITDCWDTHYHIQTYFVLFFGEALRSEAFQKFWRHLPYVNDKLWIIRNAEMQLTRRMTQHRLRAKVLCPYWDVAKSVLHRLEVRSPENLAAVHQEFLDSLRAEIVKGTPLNPSHFFWEILITEFKSPFIKRELIRDNPVAVVHTWRWPEVVGKAGTYNTELILRHLQTT